MWLFCAERCQDLFSVLTLHREPPTKRPGRNTWHTVIQGEKMKEHLSIHRKGEDSGKRRTSWRSFSGQINTWAKQVCIEHLLELSIFIEATSLTSWVCHFLASSSPLQLGSMCLEVQAKAVTHSFHLWVCFFLYKKYVLVFSRNRYSVCLLAFIHATIVA